MRRISIAAAAGFAATLLFPAAPSAAQVAAGGGEYRLAVTGQVPVICRVKLDADQVAPAAGTVSLGTLREFCNSPAGYRVVANYPATLAQAQLLVDGRTLPLGTGGSVVVAEAPAAGQAARQLALVLPEGVQPGALSFRIEPR